jgi:hypothetical protein
MDRIRQHRFKKLKKGNKQIATALDVVPIKDVAKVG